jgi:anaerobic magnesium-protoporphyrin IX monomethyl ester cyclase
MITKVLFIKLNTPWIVDQYSDPPLGLLSVMAAAKELGLDAKLLDMAHEKDIPKSDVYAISACTPNYPEFLRVSKEIKKLYNAPVIAGGPHFDGISHERWQRDNPPIDMILRGEGEYTLSRAIECLEAGNSKKVITQEGRLDADKIPIPAREFLDRNFYFKPGNVFSGNVLQQGNSATMMTSRGCPFNCRFCASPELHKRKVRYRSIENLSKEIELLQKEYNVAEIRFQDDCFTLNRKHLKDLANVIIQAQIKYRCSIRADQVDKEITELLWNSGCREVGIGIEAAEDKILNLAVKGTTVKQNISAIQILKDKGFKVRIFIMTGLPGETAESASHMIDFLEQTKPDVVTLTSFTPTPGSDFYNNSNKYGITIINNNWLDYNQALTRDDNRPFVHTLSTATTEEMETNREMLKEYLFNRNMSNVAKYNQPYVSKQLKEHLPSLS